MLDSLTQRSKPIILTSCISLLFTLSAYCLPVKAKETKEKTTTEQATKSEQEKSPIELLIEQGDMYFDWAMKYKADKDDRSTEYFDKALELYLEVYNGYGYDDVEFLDGNFGKTLELTKNYDLAIEIYLKKLKEKPDNCSLHNDLAVFYRFKEMYKKSEQEFITAIKLDPFNESPYYNFALLRFDEKRYSESKELLRKVLKLDPEHKNSSILLNYLNKK